MSMEWLIKKIFDQYCKINSYKEPSSLCSACCFSVEEEWSFSPYFRLLLKLKEGLLLFGIFSFLVTPNSEYNKFISIISNCNIVIREKKIWIYSFHFSIQRKYMKDINMNWLTQLATAQGIDKQLSKEDGIYIYIPSSLDNDCWFFSALYTLNNYV